jgi:N-glycosylase/DNA lyase
MQLEYNGHLSTNKPVDLVATLESGQTFLWTREDQEMFAGNTSGTPVYATARRRESGEVMCLRVSTAGNRLHWESTHPDAADYLKMFRLDEDPQQIRQSISREDPNGVIETATKAFPGLRLVNEPLFPTLTSFLCSPQMSVPRIHAAVHRIAHQYGDSVEVEGREYACMPTLGQLSKATEDELRGLKLGYRSEYIVETVEAITKESPALEPLPSSPDEARKHLREYHGVGPKIADCILLYGCGLDSVVPVDTRIDDAIEKYYPEYANLSEETKARKLEDLYGEYAGHAQLYLFHFMSLSRSN